MRIDGTGAGLLVVVFAIIPWLAFRSKRVLSSALDGELPMPRVAFFWQSSFFQLFIYALALVAAARDGILLRLFPWRVVLWWPAVGLLLVAIAVLHATWRLRSESDRNRLAAILPRGRSELLPYFVLCFMASVAEEIVYRGVAYRLLVRLGAPMAAAVGLLAFAFALGHSLQGWRSAAAIFVFAVGFHGVVLYTGGLLPAIAAHFVYDIYAGLMIGRLAGRTLH